jgi:hypothetical protein
MLFVDEIDDRSNRHECDQPVCKRRQSMKQVFADVRIANTCEKGPKDEESNMEAIVQSFLTFRRVVLARCLFDTP